MIGLNLQAAAAELLVTTTDRAFRVPPGQIVRTGYVDVFHVRLACRDRMTPGDVAGAFQKVLQAGDSSAFPCPYGYWEKETFILQDGRHEWIASIMHGKTHLLVAWTEELPPSLSAPTPDQEKWRELLR